MRASRLASLAVLVICYAVLPVLLPRDTFQFTIVLSAGFAGLAVALMLEAGLISFGHALFYGIGGYTVAALSQFAGPLGIVLLLAGAAASGIIAVLTGMFVVRYRGVFFAMLNLAMAMVAYSILLKSYNLTGGSDGLVVAVNGLTGTQLSPQAFGLWLFYISLGCAVLVGVVIRAYLRSPAGWALGAIEDREIRVEYLGISANRVLLQAYALSGFLAGLGGAIAATAVGHVAPDAVYWTTSTEFVVIAVLGGRGVLGSFLGAALYELLSITAAQYLSNSWEILLGVVILLVIRFARGGLAGLVERCGSMLSRGGMAQRGALPARVP
jgi:ABC-type branched-subunit amino acid transport system permease subunit